jgi:hypothetical protein
LHPQHRYGKEARLFLAVSDTGTGRRIKMMFLEVITMQILVLYYSQSGNTQKLAQAIARGVESVNGASAALNKTNIQSL